MLIKYFSDIMHNMFLVTSRVTLTICMHIYTEQITKSHTMGLSSRECLLLPVFIDIIYLQNTYFVVLQKTLKDYPIFIFSTEKVGDPPPLTHPYIILNALQLDILNSPFTT